MDTLFRLVSLQSDQQSSLNSSRTSSSSRSSRTQQQHHHYPTYLLHQDQEQEQECYNNYNSNHQIHHHHLYMDEDFSSSSSSSKHLLPPPPSSSSASAAAHFLFEPAEFSLPQDLNLNLDFGSSSSSAASSAGTNRWAAELLKECARAVASRDGSRVQQLMWMLNELASPYGDVEQKLAAYFLQGLFARLTAAGSRTLRTLAAASDRTCSFDSTRRIALRFQELSPWQSFGHVAANGAILEAFLDGNGGGGAAQRLHILDLSNTFCTQWPTLLEALATRSADDTPHLSITTVVSSSAAAAGSPSSAAVQRVMKEISARMEKFARLMGVPFRFNVVHHAGDLSTLDLGRLDAGDAALAVNCVNALRGVPTSARRREAFLSAVRCLNPRVVTLVEEEADLDSGGGESGSEEETFLKGFRESLRFFTAYFDSLEESFPRTSNERLALERAAGRAVVDLVACPAEESAERRDTAAGWSRRMRAVGFSPAAFSDDVADDVRALLRRYRDGWSMRAAEEAENPGGGAAGIFLAWKEQPVVWASAWRA